ncbi:MAG: hypothetical protein K9G63_18490 [Melioribacteraceae bacterium]|nr:hypothetical protein [Melioribacteraceae bacterium]
MRNITIILLLLISLISATGAQTLDNGYILVVGSSGTDETEFDAAESYVEDFNEYLNENFDLPIQNSSWLEMNENTGNSPLQLFANTFSSLHETDFAVTIIAGAWVTGSDSSLNKVLLSKNTNSFDANYVMNFMNYLPSKTGFCFIPAPRGFDFPKSLLPGEIDEPTGGRLIITFDYGIDLDYSDLISEFYSAIKDVYDDEEVDIDGNTRISVSEWLGYMKSKLSEEEITMHIHKISDDKDHTIKMLRLQ